MFTINGRKHDIKGHDPGQSLAAFLRDTVRDKSCKVACGSGSCGCCAVICTSVDQGIPVTRSLNACLVPIGSLVGCSILTSSGLGSSKDGFHPVQERIGAFHASQCGYCTPGVVAACTAACERRNSGRVDGDGGTGTGAGAGVAALAEAEHRLDGNLCRCTGYRPILDVIKSFEPGVDIEDLGLHSPIESGMLAGQRGAHGEALRGGIQCPMLESNGKLWLNPSTLPELLEMLKSHSSTGGTPRIVAGNTGSGLYKDLWPAEGVVISLQRVAEMQGVTVGKEEVRVGAATTIAELVQALGEIGAAEGSTHPPGGPPHPFTALAGVLRRVAGTHVRNAATVGGNLVLSRCRHLESDVATLLAGWGAKVHLAGADATALPAVVPVWEFIRREASEEEGMGEGAVVTHVTLPVPHENDYFWCHKVAPAYSNAHAVMNAAVHLHLSRPPSKSLADSSAPAVIIATVVFGYPGHSGWACHRAAGAGVALAGEELSMASVVAAIRAVASDLTPAEHMQQYVRETAQGLLLQALAPLLQGRTGLPQAAARLLQVPSLDPPAPVKSHQEFEPADRSCAPVADPIEKDRVKLQASGEAVYAGDIDMPAGGLHAAYVTSTQACASIASIDSSTALIIPGVVGFFGASDLPPERNFIKFGFLPAPDEPIFAGEKVEYYGQPLGLVVAETKEAAVRGSQLVHVTYSDIRHPITTIPAAIKAGSFYPQGPMRGGSAAAGDAASAIAASECSIMGARLEVPSQYHFYMETQCAMCVPDEGGAMRVHCSAQYPEGVQEVVAAALGLRLHEVNAVCRRVGGGFGGKATRNFPVAAACAVAAAKLGRPVSLVLDRPTDMALVGGRNQTLVNFDVGFTKEGVIQGLDLRVWMLTGAYWDFCMDPTVFKAGIDECFAIPNMRVEIQTPRANLPPNTFMRAPGEFQSALVMGHVMDAVAAACGLDRATVRERNFTRAKPGEQEVAFTFGKRMPASEYTLPQLWDHLKASCQYEERAKQVEAFNVGSPWVKRGIALAHCRFGCYIPSKPAAVCIYHDGSVLVHCGGVELGQGLATKVKQVAVMELSKVLPEAQRPLPLHLVRMGDASTYTLPKGFATWGSATSEAACAGVRKACQELVAKLRPFAGKLGEGASWEAMVGASAQAGGLFDPCKVMLVACVGNDSSEATAMPPAYSVFGVACTEAEINVLTGERAVLRSDVLMDLGRSMNPAIDIGQAEGAFVQGLGLVLSEAVRHDPSTGRLLSDSIWHCPIPTASTIPRTFNVTLLPGSRFDRGVMSSKAVGEPPLLLSASALSAIQASVSAARRELATPQAQQGAGASASLAPGDSPKSVLEGSGAGLPAGDGSAEEGWVRLPASMENVKGALGGLDVVEKLSAAMAGREEKRSSC